MSLTRQLVNASGNHTVQICLTENSQIDSVTRYIKDGLLNGEGVIVISRRALGKILKLKIDELSFDGQPFLDRNQMRFFDAEFVISFLKSDEGLEEAAFQENIAVPITNAQSKYKKVRVFSQMAETLYKQGENDLVTQLTGSWEKLTSTQKFSVLCIYSLDKLSLGSYYEVLKRICKYHLCLTPEEQDDSIDQETSDEAMQHAFGAAWNQVIHKTAH